MKRFALKFMLCLIGFLVPSVALAADPGAKLEPATPAGIRAEALVVVENGPVERVRVDHDGSTIEAPTQWVTRPMCGSDVRNITKSDLARWRQMQKDAFAPGAPITTLGGPGQRTGPTFTYNLGANVPPAAVTAIAAVKSYLESQWVDNVTIEINLDFASMGAGVLGATGSSYLTVSYATARSSQISGMDPDDTIQSFLPVGSTIPVRYDGNTGTVTNENQVFVTRGNYNAASARPGTSRR
jgi:hypothetical protein